MAFSRPPDINIEAEHCPEAVHEWYRLTSLPDYKRQCALSRDLSLKAKKHLVFLGWKFWYVNKQGRWELRYTSPITGKNYISLTRACQGCIQEGGCNLQENTFVHQQHSLSSAPDKKIKKPRKSKKRKVLSRGLKKRHKADTDDDDDDESLDGDEKAEEELAEASNLACGRGKSLRSMMRGGALPQSSESSQHNHGTLIPWLIDSNVVPLHSAVLCRGANNVVKKGKLCREGIVCDCCGELFSPTRFEAHARCYKHKPSASIFLLDGRSLLDIQKEASSSQKKEVGCLEEERDHRQCQFQNENICFVCRFGGDIVLCDGCPSSFHLSCLGLDHVPDGDWFCPACSCKICKQFRYAKDCGDSSVLVCFQCERKHHIGCLKEQSFTHTDGWFCSETCGKIFIGLQKLMGKRIPIGANNLTWTLLKSAKSGRCGESELSWDEDGSLSQNERKLSLALSVLHESFDRVIDAFFGTDMIEDVVFSRGSELNRLNCHGFYTVVLEKNEEVISVATIRVFGKRVAEIPFVATRMQFRRQGMCGIMMNEIEKQLTLLGVEEIVLPSAQEAIDTWTKTFGFARMTLSVKSQFLDHVFLDFKDIIMCHKVLVKQFVT
ncbi:increased DNA methylation 1 [Cajanus cajan]|uniref:increased DNA methylation 1 n=1 Tax=Cajanus cajan TaxID=3821 RepID=UPI00098DA16C|nr:increased DNA methylation 1 [Cajanus cajan]